MLSLLLTALLWQEPQYQKLQQKTMNGDEYPSLNPPVPDLDYDLDTLPGTTPWPYTPYPMIVELPKDPPPLVDQPNILIVTFDDLGIEYVNCYGEGPSSRQGPTPNIDAVAARGMRFTNAWSCPVCSPTRAMMLTGRWPNRTGIGEAIGPSENIWLKQAEVTLPDLLPNYSAHIFGKWHIGKHWGPYDPIIHGFEYHSGTISGLEGDYYYWPHSMSWRFNNISWYESTYSEELLANECAWVIPSIYPWLTFMNFHAPHSPYQDPPGMHTDGSNVERYKAMLEFADMKLGYLLSFVDWDNTYVFIVSDNGCPAAVASTSGNKATVKEGGINVPFIVAGPGIVQGVSTAIVSLVDIYATVAELCGAVSSAEDSHSLVQLFSDPTAGVRTWNYSEMFTSADAECECVDRRAARDGRYKLIWNKGVETFYDLSLAGPGEDGPPIAPVEPSYSTLKQVITNRGR